MTEQDLLYACPLHLTKYTVPELPVFAPRVLNKRDLLALTVQVYLVYSEEDGRAYDPIKDYLARVQCGVEVEEELYCSQHYERYGRPTKSVPLSESELMLPNLQRCSLGAWMDRQWEDRGRWEYYFYEVANQYEARLAYWLQAFLGNQTCCWARKGPLSRRSETSRYSVAATNTLHGCRLKDMEYGLVAGAANTVFCTDPVGLHSRATSLRSLRHIEMNLIIAYYD